MRISLLLLIAGMAFSSLQVSAEPEFSISGGRKLPLSAVTLKDGVLTTTKKTHYFQPGASLPLSNVVCITSDVVPAEIEAAYCELLSEREQKVEGLVGQGITQQAPYAAIPGNHAIEMSKLLMVSVASLGKDPFEALKKYAPNMSEEAQKQLSDFKQLASTLQQTVNKNAEQAEQLKKFISDQREPDSAALAGYFRGAALVKLHKNEEALEAFLSATAINSASNLLIRAACSLRAAKILSELSAKPEAAIQLEDAVSEGGKSVIGEEAAKLLKSYK